MNALRYLTKEASLAGGAAGSADPRFSVDDDVVGIDQLCPQQRNKRQLRRCRIAAGNGNKARQPDSFALNLGQAVDRFPLQLGGPMLVAIPLGVGRGVRKPEIG